MDPRFGLALPLALMLAQGCRSDEAATSDTGSASNTSPRERLEFLRKAHADALRRAVPLAQRAILAADPLTATIMDDAPLRAPPLAPAALARVRDDLRAARRELESVDAELLEPADAVMHHLTSFGLERIADAMEGRPPTRTDPGYAIDRSLDVLDALEDRVAAGETVEVEATLESIATELRTALLDLGAASSSSLDAAIDDLQAITERMQALAHAGEAARLVAGQRQALQAQRAALPAAPNAAWAHAIASAGAKPSLLRLPEILGADDLQRRLEVEEGLSRPPAEALPQLMQLMRHFDALAARHGVENVIAAPPLLVDDARCQAAFDRLRSWADKASADDLEPGRVLDCDIVRRRSNSKPRTDAEVLLDVLDQAWIRPRVRARRHAAERTSALVGGRIAPRSHALLAAVVVAASLDDPVVLDLALRRARHAACQAGASVWLHAELGPKEKLDAWLGSECPWEPPEAFKDAALARPRRSLEGLGLVLAGTGPAGATMLEHFAWAPLGLVPVLATPAELQHPDPEPLPGNVDIEWFGR